MSRSLTAAQVIALGEYLDPDFDPSTLTVSQLLGVFGFHNIRYPTPYTKPKLVLLFNDEIKSKATKLKKERVKKENSLPSDDGIKDGVTGKLLNEDAKPLRRSSRRSSRAPSVESDIASVQPEAPKRRRSSAQPSLGGPSTRSGQPINPVLVEESEPEEEVAVRKVSRGKKSVRFQEDSGWEDNNIFQSGAESSSPARPPPKPRARKSAAPKAPVARKSTRKARSAPPEHLPSSSPPQTPFKTAGSPLRPLKIEDSPEEEEVDELDEVNDADESGAGVIDVTTDAEEESEDAKYANAVSRRITDPTIVRREPEAAPFSSVLLRTLTVFAGLALYAFVLPYKRQSAAIGFCDTGTKTNAVLETLRTRNAAIEACNRENRTHLYLPSTDSQANEENQALCPPPPFIPWFPDECTPCPEHAVCTRDSVTCTNGFLLRPHTVLSFLPFPHTNTVNPAIPHATLSPVTEGVLNAVTTVLDGLPSLGPVALPPRCVEDPKRKKHIGVLGKAIEAVLGQERGKRVCASEVPEVKDELGGEAKRWGMDMDALRAAMKKKTAPQLLDQFDDTFNEAIQQLVQWGGVWTGEGPQGEKYIAHKKADLDWHCTLTVKSREAWKEWRGRVIGALALVVSAFVARARRAQRQIESKRVAELVQVALDALRNQELAHHTDPVTAPQPYLSSLQLRDLILQDEHAVSRRRRLWDQVERVVEGNANVRANLEEVHGGDELRVWRWVGGAGRRKVQFEGAEGRVVA
ncbi:hypothetical protein BV25DRAFT_1800192 [Artomyces pyxidatus]|uniref:Uncharacterized protein n=1 Tax=Artomyces pyxidatus TaxID=48021 RepID=A0ACB8T8K5_9AGAM|nr:hypothetical protein BV25DRAFT_1800192 [Artomyces pyxidatus]